MTTRGCCGSASARCGTTPRPSRHFFGSTAPDNEPSLAVLRKLGFAHVGDHWDEEDGFELVFELRYPAAAT